MFAHVTDNNHSANVIYSGAYIMSKLLLVLVFATSSTVALRAQTLVTNFDARNGVGAKIFADGNRLLLDDSGAGFYLIGSNDDTDDGNNIASFVPNNNGVMRAMNGAPTPYLPYSLTFQADSQDRNKLFFNISLGPSAFPFTTVSMPIDGRLSRFTYWRYEGTTSLGRYDQILTNCYTPPGGHQACIKAVPGNPRWGEMIGPDYTIRVTLSNSSRPMHLFFVSAPGLSTGARNVEFSFGPLNVGERATASGFIQVSRTDPALFAQSLLTFQSETYPYHQIGRRDGDGWSVRVGDTPNQYMNYGPYTTAVLPGRRTATFRLMLDNTTADNNRILTLDVFDAVTGRTLASRSITRREFTRGLQYQDFDFNFTATTWQLLEFRTLWHGSSYARQDYVRVR